MDADTQETSDLSDPAVSPVSSPVSSLVSSLPAKKNATPLVRAKQALGADAAEAAGTPQTQAQAGAARLAQIVNLHIAGFSLAQIGAQIGATADEVDRMLQADATRYVRTQPALRTYVRNWVSERYMKLLDAVWDDAVDMTTNHKLTVQGFDKKLASQDRAIKILDRMAKLHGADAPVQTEVKIEAAPEAVERLVQALSAAQGMGYDEGIFDVVDAEVVHEGAEQSQAALEFSAQAVEDSQPGDEEGL